MESGWRQKEGTEEDPGTRDSETRTQRDGDTTRYIYTIKGG